MKILAVSDEPSRSLETLITNEPEKYKGVDLIVSCGDLDTEYLEYLVDSLQKDFFFIRGNHPLENSGDYLEPQERVSFQNKTVRYIAGYPDLHGRTETYGDYIFTGFGGSIWYNGEYNQFTEEQMSEAVKTVERKISWLRLQDRLMRRRAREVIVISHAPIANIHDQPDKPHKGFKCFEKFIEKVSPLLWLHGHIHLPNQYTNQITKTGETTVVNAFGCKVLEINQSKIEVFAHCYNGI